MAEDAGYTLRDINMIDDAQTWVTAFDDEGMEVEVTISGLSLRAIAEWIDKDPEMRRQFEVARSVVDV